MPTSLFTPDFQSILDQAVNPPTPAAAPFLSPEDWRDRWIYFLMLDRFNNPSAPPAHQPFDDPNFFGFQGGKFSGVQQQIAHIKQLGAGAIWLSPVLKNFQFDPNTYHGYGIHNFIGAEPRFADNPAAADNELRALVDAAHQQDLLVIFDIVLNHTATHLPTNAIRLISSASITRERSPAFTLRSNRFNGATKPVPRAPTSPTLPRFPIRLSTLWYGLLSCSKTSSSAAKAHPMAMATTLSAISASSSNW